MGVQAAELPRGSLERLLKVTAFAVSIYSCVYRPFAPCRSPKGETFEIVAPDKGIRCIGEKVRISTEAGFLDVFAQVSMGTHVENLGDSCDTVWGVPGSECLPLRGPGLGAIVR